MTRMMTAIVLVLGLVAAARAAQEAHASFVREGVRSGGVHRST